jgi:hypothetical protein
MDQKNAVEIKQSIGSQELARKGVSDVATAVTKTSGIKTRRLRKYLCKRFRRPIQLYNRMAPFPSNDPEKKNLNLEIFSTDIVEYISIDKVYGGKYMAILLEETLTL